MFNDYMKFIAMIAVMAIGATHFIRKKRVLIRAGLILREP